MGATWQTSIMILFLKKVFKKKLLKKKKKKKKIIMYPILIESGEGVACPLPFSSLHFSLSQLQPPFLPKSWICRALD